MPAMADELADLQQVDHVGIVTAMEPRGGQLLMQHADPLAREQALTVMCEHERVAAIRLQTKNIITRHVEVPIGSRHQ